MYGAGFQSPIQYTSHLNHSGVSPYSYHGSGLGSCNLPHCIAPRSDSPIGVSTFSAAYPPTGGTTSPWASTPNTPTCEYLPLGTGDRTNIGFSTYATGLSNGNGCSSRDSDGPVHLPTGLSPTCLYGSYLLNSEMLDSHQSHNGSRGSDGNRHGQLVVSKDSEGLSHLEESQELLDSSLQDADHRLSGEFVLSQCIVYCKASW